MADLTWFVPSYPARWKPSVNFLSSSLVHLAESWRAAGAVLDSVGEGLKAHPKLKEHIAGVVALLRASDDWTAFKRSLDRAYPKFGETIEMALSGGGKKGDEK